MEKEKIGKLTQELMEHVAELLMKSEGAEETKDLTNAYVNLLENGGRYFLPRNSMF